MSLLRSCAETSEWFSRLPEEVFGYLASRFLSQHDRARLVRACFPRARVITRWSHGSRQLYALGFLWKETHDHTMMLEHLIALRRGLFLLSCHRGNIQVQVGNLEYQPDWRRVGRCFAALRGQIRARDYAEKTPCAALAARLLGFRSLEEWHETLVELLYNDLSKRRVWFL